MSQSLSYSQFVELNERENILVNFNQEQVIVHIKQYLAEEWRLIKQTRGQFSPEQIRVDGTSPCLVYCCLGLVQD